MYHSMSRVNSKILWSKKLDLVHRCYMCKSLWLKSTCGCSWYVEVVLWMFAFYVELHWTDRSIDLHIVRMTRYRKSVASTVHWKATFRHLVTRHQDAVKGSSNKHLYANRTKQMHSKVVARYFVCFPWPWLTSNCPQVTRKMRVKMHTHHSMASCRHHCTQRKHRA